ncbi:hypothetical protein HPB51_010556 [Rhipicephalus microplus]|uniref:Uncharacterized protein n=1 Tax=Rhipicephalus microplus TaxID=6941 RepID=A0A9J6E8H1_RHIMP|nr:hypothetical protein HPB51_010556 [Rhipicephalus microplus]
MNSNESTNTMIDVPSTSAALSHTCHGEDEIIANDQGNRTSPRYVTFTETERLISDPAKAHAAGSPMETVETVFSSKRLTGCTFDELELQDDLKRLSCTRINDNSEPKIKVTYKSEEKVFNPEEISAVCGSHMRHHASLLQFALTGNQGRLNYRRSCPRYRANDCRCPVLRPGQGNQQ